jgi:hypothetical protein
MIGILRSDADRARSRRGGLIGARERLLYLVPVPSHYNHAVKRACILNPR